ncbi:MAG: Crp/Fnr family transcriptional regulator [Brevundimonas sp.]
MLAGVDPITGPRTHSEMIETLIAKLEQFAPLSSEDQTALRAAISRTEEFARGEDIVVEGDRPDAVYLVLGGWAGRYKLTENGDRHIMAFLIPGDVCDVHVTLLEKMDHGIQALSPCHVAVFPADTLAVLMAGNWRIGAALLWSTLVDEAILREWLVNIGGRQTDQRVAHLFCEMLHRLEAVGLVSNDSFALPVTQEQLADSMGVSPVHMNRTIKDLRARKLIEIKSGRICVRDVDALMDFAGFDGSYLHRMRRAVAPAWRHARTLDAISGTQHS